MEKAFSQLLLGGDHNGHAAVDAVHHQADFDALFGLIFHHERLLVIRAVDAVERITRKHPQYLVPHKAQLLALIAGADHNTVKWHIAQLIARVPLHGDEAAHVWHVLSYWVRNVNENKVVRGNSLQGLYELSRQHPEYLADLQAIVATLEHERSPSIQARVRQLKTRLGLAL